jgi:hypothetical protein
MKITKDKIKRLFMIVVSRIYNNISCFIDHLIILILFTVSCGDDSISIIKKYNATQKKTFVSLRIGYRIKIKLILETVNG